MSGKPAARITDMHVCPASTGPVPHVGGPIITGEPTVLIGNLPAARISDKAICNGPLDVVVQGSPTVIIGNMPASRIGDRCAHGGVIVSGMPTVLIGESGGIASQIAAAVLGAGQGQGQDEETEDGQDELAAKSGEGADSASPDKGPVSRVKGMDPKAADEAIQQALDDSVAVLKKRQKDLATFDDATKAQFKEYFGSTTEAARKTIGDRIDKTLDKLESFGLDNFKPDKEFYGQANPADDTTIFLGDAFATAPATGRDSKAGVLIHEASHFKSVGGTVDWNAAGQNVYGETAVRKLAKDDSAQALKHADAFEYFIEDGF